MSLSSRRCGSSSPVCNSVIHLLSTMLCLAGKADELVPPANSQVIVSAAGLQHALSSRAATITGAPSAALPAVLTTDPLPRSARRLSACPRRGCCCWMAPTPHGCNSPKSFFWLWRRFWSRAAERIWGPMPLFVANSCTAQQQPVHAGRQLARCRYTISDGHSMHGSRASLDMYACPPCGISSLGSLCEPFLIVIAAALPSAAHVGTGAHV